MTVTKGTRKIGTTIFRMRKVRLSRAHFVEIVEFDGTSQRLGPFETRRLAEDWIRTKSEKWLADQRPITDLLDLELPLHMRS